MRFLRAVQTLAWLVYPLLIYFGLQFMQPRYVALLLLSVLLIRRYRDAQRFMACFTFLDRGVLLLLLALAGGTALTNSELLLRLYPAAVCCGSLAVFAMSLYRPPSMIERFARLQQPDLPPEGVVYTRKVTYVWCGFMFMNASLAFYTALWTSREIWSLYNGLISYVLMGTLFVGEWVYRKWVMKAQAA